MSDPRFIPVGFEKRLSHLVQECCEVILAATKLQIFGPHGSNPLLPFDEAETNLAALLREIDDIQQAIERLKISISQEFGA